MTKSKKLVVVENFQPLTTSLKVAAEFDKIINTSCTTFGESVPK